MEDANATAPDSSAGAFWSARPSSAVLARASTRWHRSLGCVLEYAGEVIARMVVWRARVTWCRDPVRQMPVILQPDAGVGVGLNVVGERTRRVFDLEGWWHGEAAAPRSSSSLWCRPPLTACAAGEACFVSGNRHSGRTLQLRKGPCSSGPAAQSVVRRVRSHSSQRVSLLQGVLAPKRASGRWRTGVAGRRRGCVRHSWRQRCTATGRTTKERGGTT